VHRHGAGAASAGFVVAGFDSAHAEFHEFCDHYARVRASWVLTPNGAETNEE
jgi:hypothetical protein